MPRHVAASLIAAAILAAGLAAAPFAFAPVAAHTGHTFAAGEPGDPAKPFRTITIEIKDGPGMMAYSPNRIEVRKGEQIKFVLTNTGDLRHEFLLGSL